MNSVTRPTTVASVPLLTRRGEDAGDELTAGRDEAFELGLELARHLLPPEYHPGHADDEQHQRRQGERGVVR